MNLRNEIRKKIPGFETICRSHDVKYLYAFGSSARDSINSGTNTMLLLVELNESEPSKRGEKIMSLWETIESNVQRKVEMITESSYINPFLKISLNTTKTLIYHCKETSAVNSMAGSF